MWAYLIVTGFYVLVAAILAMLGIRSLKNVKGPERATAQAQEAMETLTRAQPGQLVRAEHQDGDHCDDRQLGKSDSGTDQHLPIGVRVELGFMVPSVRRPRGALR
jgi:Putative Actinobacterial Holin-X, holin superfamily III